MNLEYLALIHEGWLPVPGEGWLIHFGRMLIKWEEQNQLSFSKLKRNTGRWSYWNGFDKEHSYFSKDRNNPDDKDYNPIIEKMYREWLENNGYTETSINT